MASILVAGDVVANTNLVRLPAGSSLRSEELPTTLIRRAAGGAHYLAAVVHVACADLDAAIHGAGPGGRLVLSPDSSSPETLTVWARYSRRDRDPHWVWRVEHFVRAAVLDPFATPEDVPHTPEGDAAEVPSSRAPASGSPRILVLDDENFGFRDQPSLWQSLIADDAPPDHVVLKTRYPLGAGPLWQELIDRHADRLTVVVPVSALRARRAAIARGLSWDRAIEDVSRELRAGESAEDLARARRVVVPFSVDGAAVFTRDGRRPMSLHRFVYRPDRLEGDTLGARPGRMLGGSSILTAALVRHLARPDDYPIFVAVSRGLAAMGTTHERGGGPAEEVERVADILVPFAEDGYAQAQLQGELLWSPVTPFADDGVSLAEHPPESAFRAVSEVTHGSLLGEVAGRSPGRTLATAVHTVLVGAQRALDSAPRVRYGSFETVDREEIERTNEIRRLLEAYRTSPETAPLSLAVFGPPGSGKSFAIKQLARHLFGEGRASLQWNLSQMRDRQDLLEAFDQIRDASVRGELPLVFWDEFDSGELRWLQEFLAPMQDAAYCAGSLSHPFGKAIFVFAGGTSATFQEFDRSRTGDSLFRSRKGPDFVSRLRGYLNIKGPNPQAVRAPSEDVGPGAAASADRLEEAKAADTAYLIRRAMLLRSLVTQAHPHLVDPASGVAAISPSVIRGFLTAQTYLHGARSMEAIVGMSALAGARHFGVAELPSPELLALHASPDFLARVREGEREEEFVDVLATAAGARTGRHALGRSAETRRHEARLLVEDLRDVGIQVPPDPTQGRGRADAEEQLAGSRDRLADVISRRWTREQALRGRRTGDDHPPHPDAVGVVPDVEELVDDVLTAWLHWGHRPGLERESDPAPDEASDEAPHALRAGSSAPGPGSTPAGRRSP